MTLHAPLFGCFYVGYSSIVAGLVLLFSERLGILLDEEGMRSKLLMSFVETFSTS